MKDTMAIFRRIIGYIARIDDFGWVKVEDVAQDMEKLNLATLAGWRVLQFDSKMIKTGAAIEIINQALEITK